MKIFSFEPQPISMLKKSFLPTASTLPFLGLKAKMAQHVATASLICCIAICFAVQGGFARPAEGLTVPSEDAAVNRNGRHLTQTAEQAGCADAGTSSCCYNSEWWIQQQVAPSVTCTTGTLDSSITPEFLLNACQEGAINPHVQCIAHEDCNEITDGLVTCDYYENIGDYTGSFPCETVDFNGQNIQVYDDYWLQGNNDEIVWEAASVAANEGTGGGACDSEPVNYSYTATYSKTSSWNIGIQLGTKILSDIETKLTAGFSQSYSAGTNSGVTFSVDAQQHGSVKHGALIHHTIGWWNVAVTSDSTAGQAQNYKGCSNFRIDNVASDLVMPTSDPRFPTDYYADVQPCGYPLLNGKLF